MTIGEDPLRPRTFKRDVWSWLTALTLAAAAVIALYIYQHHTVMRGAVAAQALSDDPRVVVLSYDRVVAAEDGTHVHARRMREQLAGLRAEGFEPVTLEALGRFYMSGVALPPKSLVLTFEYGYLDTYRIVDPILEEFGWNATVSLITNRQAVKDTSFLYWDRLQRMVNSGRWDVAIQGHRAMDHVAVAGDAMTAPFINQRVWLNPARRIETGEEYVARVTGDLRTAKRLVEQNLPGYAVRAYSYPYDSIALRSSDPEVQAGFERALIACCDLAFSDDLFGVNGAGDDPRRLHRLRVRAEWSADELLRRIGAASHSPSLTPDPRRPTLWVDAAGRIIDTGATLNLGAAPNDHAWLAGSRWNDAWRLRADIEVRGGQFWLTHSDEPHGTGWRVGGEGTQLSVQALERGRPARTLAQFDTTDISGAHQSLTVTTRGAGLWVEWNNHPLNELPIYVDAVTGGSLGWSTWSENGTSRLVVREIKIEGRPAGIVAVSARPGVDEVQQLAGHADDIGAIAVPVPNVDAPAESLPDRDLLRVLARRYGWEVIPEIAADASLHADSLVAALDRFEVSPMRHVAVTLNRLDTDTRRAFERDTLPELRATLRRRGIRVLTRGEFAPNPDGDRADLAVAQRLSR